MDLSFNHAPFACLVLLFLSTAADETPSVYQLLQQFDFPIGLLPKGATGYELNNATCDFEAYLGDVACSFSLEGSYELKYKSTIKGKISKDKLTKLEGVSVKVVGMWMNIVEVQRRGDHLEFSVWIASANFPVVNFEECPQCGCGLKCDHGEANVKLNRFVSSS